MEKLFSYDCPKAQFNALRKFKHRKGRDVCLFQLRNSKKKKEKRESIRKAKNHLDIYR
jgi:hypothetical protein